MVIHEVKTEPMWNRKSSTAYVPRDLNDRKRFFMLNPVETMLFKGKIGNDQETVQSERNSKWERLK